jgi:hypothetical protein
MPMCRAIRAAYNSRAATVQLGSSYRAATPLPTHRHQGNRCFGWSDVPGYRCVDGDCGKEASRVAISVDLLRRDVGILFVSAAYCDANVWRYFLFGAQIGEEIMDDEMRREFSKLYDALIHVGAKNDFGWISLAFTVNYVLLGIILWRLFG